MIVAASIAAAAAAAAAAALWRRRRAAGPCNAEDGFSRQCSAPPPPPPRGKHSWPKDAVEVLQEAPEEVGETLELLAEVRAAAQRLSRLKETSKCEGWAKGLKVLPVDELRAIKKGLDAELSEAEALQGAEEKEVRRLSRVRTLTAEEARALSAAAEPSAPPLGTSTPTLEPSAPAAEPSAPPLAAPPAASALQQALRDPLLLLGPGVAGLRWDSTWASDPAGPYNEDLRHKVRRGTREKVRRELGLTFFGQSAGLARKMPPQARSSCLFRDVGEAAQEGLAPAGGYNLLGRYDVCCVRACADLDRKWRFQKGPKEFWVAHAAAVNVGESADARDFCDFQKPGDEAAKALDERKYVEAMGHIMDNIVSVCTELQIERMVFFPFGMGAFLRNLRRIDATFTQEVKILRLRRAVAARLVGSWAKLPKGLEVRLCLQFGSPEARDNADAFLRAVVGSAGGGNGSSPIKDSVVIVPEGDALSVASDLAVTSDKVLLVNGANRQLIGNHWFAGGAKMAIDENLHRRSWRLSALAYVLNEYDGEQDASQRQPDTLAKRVEQLGGTVVDLSG